MFIDKPKKCLTSYICSKMKSLWTRWAILIYLICRSMIINVHLTKSFHFFSASIQTNSYIMILKEGCLCTQVSGNSMCTIKITKYPHTVFYVNPLFIFDIQCYPMIPCITLCSPFIYKIHIVPLDLCLFLCLIFPYTVFFHVLSFPILAIFFHESKQMMYNFKG